MQIRISTAEAWLDAAKIRKLLKMTNISISRRRRGYKLRIRSRNCEDSSKSYVQIINNRFQKLKDTRLVV